VNFYLKISFQDLMVMVNKKTSNIQFIKWFGPLLDALRELGGSGRKKEVVQQIAKDLKLPDEQLEETMKSGSSRFDNQVGWARQYLLWEGLLDSSQRGVWSITPKGQETFLNVSQARDIFLKWVEIHTKARKNKTKTDIVKEQQEEEPENIEDTITPSLLEILQSLSSSGFENICKRLLREHGFEDVIVTGGSHDGGIDGYGTLELNPFVSLRVSPKSFK
jgi:restriction system protein